MVGNFHHKDAVEELKCPKSILLQRSKMVILRVAIIKLQAGVCASSIFSHSMEPTEWSQFLTIRRIEVDSSGGERRAAWRAD